MTTLGREVVAETKYNSIILNVSGDLSHTYEVVQKGKYTQIGIPFVTKTRALEFARKTGKLGFAKQYEIYKKSVNWYNSNVSEEDSAKFIGGKSFGYLPEKKALKYLPYAYDEYAEKLRKKHGIKEQKDEEW